MWAVFSAVSPEPWKAPQPHVVPMHDIGEHTANLKCHCHPTVDEDDVVQHRAFDCRRDEGWTQ